jgi:hypothetical protein
MPRIVEKGKNGKGEKGKRSRGEVLLITLRRSPLPLCPFSPLLWMGGGELRIPNS